VTLGNKRMSEIELVIDSFQVKCKSKCLFYDIKLFCMRMVLVLLQ